MRFKKLFCLVITCVMVMGCLSVEAGAVSEAGPAGEARAVSRASGRFSAEVPADTLYTAKSSFPLEAGETVSISAVYSPRPASVDFGVIAPDGLFYSVNTTAGSFDGAIEVSEKGYYTFAIRNNASSTLSVSGYVSY